MTWTFQSISPSLSGRLLIVSRPVCVVAVRGGLGFEKFSFPFLVTLLTLFGHLVLGWALLLSCFFFFFFFFLFRYFSTSPLSSRPSRRCIAVHASQPLRAGACSLISLHSQRAHSLNLVLTLKRRRKKKNKLGLYLIDSAATTCFSSLTFPDRSAPIHSLTNKHSRRKDFFLFINQSTSIHHHWLLCLELSRSHFNWKYLSY